MDFNFDDQFDSQVIGVDEVGKGSWAGPVMACAALLNYKVSIDKRLDDSKKLSQKNRKEVLKALIKNNLFGIGEVSNHKIDQLGIIRATFLAMEMALTDLRGKCKNFESTIILIDGILTPDFIKKFNTNYKIIKKGDTLSPSIAAASIFAKCYRDDFMIEMDKKYYGYGFSTNMGYGSKKHREKLLLSGPTQLHRMSFNPMKKLK